MSRVRICLMVVACFLFTSMTMAFWPFRPVEYRGLWVDAFSPGFHTPAEVEALVQTARDYNYNALFVEVRKMCDAYYDSHIEPKATDVKPQDFNPLDYLIDLCHDTSGGKQYIEVHAWLVAYRAKIKGYDIPQWEPKHILLRHPEWVSRDYNGNNEFNDRQFLDQAIPGVIDYTTDVVMDIVKYYDVDGIQFDYIRYAEAMVNKANAWGYHPIAIQRFNRLYNRTGIPEPGLPEWGAFRRQQLADQLRKVYANIKALKPYVKLSAATITWGGVDDFKSSASYVNTLQDWVGWMEGHLLDLNCLMNYKREHDDQQGAQYRDWARLAAQTKNGRHAIIGQGAFMNSIEDSITQMKTVRKIHDLDGILTYCYATTNVDKKPPEEFFGTVKRTLFKRRAKIPEAKWLTKPKVGIVMGTVSAGGERIDGAAVEIDAQRVRTDGTGFYAVFDLEPGRYQIRASMTGIGTAEDLVTIEAGKVAKLNMGLKK
jgi:uncharacterized lipoprotein YddW (UPF0748 family)